MDAPETITIELPFNTNGRDIEPRRETLRRLLESKASLINAALGEDAYWYAPEEEYSPENPGDWSDLHQATTLCRLSLPKTVQ